MVCAMMKQASCFRAEFARVPVNAAFKPVHIWVSQSPDFPGKLPFQSLNKPVAVTGCFAIVRPNSQLWGLLHMTSSHGDYQPGSMDISQHRKFYKGFLTGTKWTFLLVLGIMIFLAVFRTH
jgi:hypothetical protein